MNNLETKLRGLKLEKQLLISEIDIYQPDDCPIDKLVCLAKLVLNIRNLELEINSKVKNTLES